MFYIGVEYEPGRYVVGGEGADETAALANLNKHLAELPDAVPFDSMQALSAGLRAGRPSAYVATESREVYAAFFEDFDLQ